MEGSTVAVGGDSDESQCYIGTWCVGATGGWKAFVLYVLKLRNLNGLGGV